MQRSKTPNRARPNERWFLLRGSIVQRKAKNGSPLYYVVILRKWYKVLGKQSRRNAELYCAQLLTELDRGEHIKPNQMTVAELWERWKLARFADLAAETRGSMEQGVRTLILPALGYRSITALTSEDIERWKSALIEEEYASVTVETALRRLSTILQDAVKWRHLRQNPALGVRGPRKDRKEMKFLTREQILLVLETVPDLQWKAMILTTIVAGLRITETAACRWRHLDWENCQYYVAERRVYRYKQKGFEPPKTQYSKASVMLTPHCLEVLREHQRGQAEKKLRAGAANDFIFTNRTGGAFNPAYVRRRWEQILIDAGIPHVRFHDLRHTCATLWIDQGESPKFVQKQMRHASIQTTYDVYGHLFPETNMQASERFDEALFGKSG